MSKNKYNYTMTFVCLTNKEIKLWTIKYLMKTITVFWPFCKLKLESLNQKCIYIISVGGRTYMDVNLDLEKCNLVILQYLRYSTSEHSLVLCKDLICSIVLLSTFFGLLQNLNHWYNTVKGLCWHTNYFT